MKILIDKKYGYFNFCNIKKIKNIKKERLSQFAGIIKNKNNLKIYRDALGINKIFFLLKKKKIYISSNYLNLSKKTSQGDQIYSCPPGNIISISKEKITKEKYDFIKKYNFSEKLYLNILKKKIQKELILVKKNFANHNFIICLSSGHDSNLILTYAKKILGKRVKICSFAYIENEKLKKNIEQNIEKNIDLMSEDFKHAQKISKILNIEFIPVFFSINDIKKNIKKIIFACQDYRDFNVHCAIGNFFIGQKLKKYKKNIVLTGDLMNEFFADYHTELIGSKKYYIVPNIDFKKKQKAFIVGLDTSDREIGVFHYHGIKLRQIFSVVRDLAISIPEKKLKIKNFRQKINKKLIEKGIYKHMRPSKIRAQLGKSRVGPTIPYSLEKNGLNRRKLKKIWLSLFSKKYKDKNNMLFLSQYNSI